MNDLQAKFVIILLGVAFLLSYALPQLKELKHEHDRVVQQLSKP